MGKMDGKVALITGGASGLGAADARLLAAEGARVVITDLQQNLGETVARERLFRRDDVGLETEVLIRQVLDGAEADQPSRVDRCFEPPETVDRGSNHLAPRRFFADTSPSTTARPRHETGRPHAGVRPKRLTEVHQCSVS